MLSCFIPAARIKLPKGGVGRDYVLVQLKINGKHAVCLAMLTANCSNIPVEECCIIFTWRPASSCCDASTPALL
jgi:hypothetical protein